MAEPIAKPLASGVLATFIAELQSERFESETARKCVEELGAWGLLMRAIWYARVRDLPSARRDRDAALAAAPGSAEARLVAGLLSIATRDQDRALRELLAAAEQRAELLPQALEFASALADRLGWTRETREVAELGIARDRDPRSGDRYLRAQMYLMKAHRRYDEALAAAHALLALQSTPDAQADSHLEIARIAGAAGRVEDAETAVIEALRLAPSSAELRYDAGEILVEAGAFDRADGLLRESFLMRPSSKVASRLAELKLWAGDLGAAAETARRALDVDQTFGAAHRTLGICAFAEGRLGDALSALDRAILSNPGDMEAYLWRARVRIRIDPVGAGEEDLERAASAGAKLYLPAEILRIQIILAQMLTQRSPWEAVRQTLGAKPRPLLAKHNRQRLRERMEPILPTLEESFPEAEAVIEVGDGDAIQGLLSRIIQGFGFNCSGMPTTVREGRLERAVQPSAREEARAALETIAVVGPAEVRTALEEVMKRYPATSRPECFLGELCVWLGQVAEARQHLQHVIARAPATQWAYVGLAACDLLEKKPDAALKMLAVGVERCGSANASVLAHRGEALRLLGRFTASRRDLQASLQATPGRISGWINLGLTCGAEKDKAGLEEAFTMVRGRAPGLISDAAAELSEPAWLVGDAPPPAITQHRLLDHALGMMRGNRSSGALTYFASNGRLRCIFPTAVDLAATDRPDLAAAEALLSAYGPKDLR